jgi:carboxymethylenebutenolidase
MEIKTITLPTRKIEVEVYAPAQSSEKACYFIAA